MSQLPRIERKATTGYGAEQWPYSLVFSDRPRDAASLSEADLARLVAQGAALMLSGRTEGHQPDGSLRFGHIGVTIRRTDDGGVSIRAAVNEFDRDEARALLFWLAREFTMDEEAEG